MPEPDPGALEPADRLPSAAAVAGVYAGVAALWILGSDSLLTALVSDPVWHARLGMAKGWAFVAVTAALLYVLLRRRRGRAAARPAWGRRLRLQILAAALGIAALAGLALQANHQQHVRVESARLETVAELRVREAGRWLAERRGHADFTLNSRFFADLFERAYRQGSADDARSLHRRLQEFAHSAGMADVMLVSREGVELRSDGSTVPLPPLLAQVVGRALAGDSVLMTELYRPHAQAAPRMDLIVPWVLTGRPAQAGLVLRLGIAETLLPAVAAWPVPSATAQASLVARIGDELVGAHGREPRRLDQPRLLAARVLRGEVPFGAVAQGEDFRGRQVYGVVRPVAGTNLFLSLRIETDEVAQAAWQDAGWIVAAGLFSLLAATAGLRLRQQARAGRDAVAAHQAQLQAARDELRRADEKQQWALAHSMAGIGAWAWDMRADRVEWSPECRALLGELPDPPTAASVFGRTHPDDLAAVRTALDTAVRDHTLFDAQLRFTTADGRELWLANLGRAQYDADGTPLRMVGTLQDITSRKRAELALADSEARLRVTVDESPVAIADVSPAGVLLSANPQLERLTGYTRAELVGMHVGALSHPEDRSGDEDHIRRALAGEIDRFAFDKRYRRKDGRDLWVRVTAHLMRDADARPAGFLTAVLDIDDRKRAEAALHERDALFSEMSSLAHVGGWSFDPASGQSSWTDEVARIHDMEPGAPVSGRVALTMFEGEHRRRLQDAVTAAVQHGRPYDLELPTTTRAGRHKWVRTVGLPVYEDGRLVSLRGYTQDITDRKLAELELHRHRDHLEDRVRERTEQLARLNAALAQQSAEIADLYNRAPCGYHTLDAEGRIVAVNDTELRMLGYRRDELIGRHMLDTLVPPGRGGEFAQALAHVHRGEPMVDQPFSYRCRDGTLLPVAIHVSLVRDKQGRVLHTHSAVFDDRVRRAHQTQIAALNAELAGRAADAESASRSKSSFLAAMSHEIRTPMNAILGLTQLLRRDAVDATAAQRLDKVRGAAHHLLAVIDDVLDLSKIEAGKLSLTTADFLLDDLLVRLDAVLGDRARDKGLALEIDTEGVPRRVHGDETRLAQALLNLVGNAIKYTDAGRIRVELRLLQQRGDELLLQFSVSDTGAGIAADKIGRLFHAFEQGDEAAARRVGGTGLGLAITRHLAQLMGGEVGVDSEPERGSRFWFTARLREAAPAVAEPVPLHAADTALPAARRGTLHVLLAEDNEINREVALEMLSDWGARADVATDGREAVQLAAGSRYDLILMDMQMPHMDGVEATRAIRRLPLHAHTPIVAMTANAFAEDRLACLNAGMNDFITKPVGFDTLHRLLDRYAVAAPAAAGM